MLFQENIIAEICVRYNLVEVQVKVLNISQPIIRTHEAFSIDMWGTYHILD